MNLDWGALLGQVSLWLAIVALVLACFQSWEARKQTKRLQSHSSALVLITESLSTRYIGPFPDYLSSATEIINSSHRELQIIVGNPAPAYFSSPSAWMDYTQAVERKARSGVAVRLVCMGEAQRRRRLEQQFPTSQSQWETWIVDKQAEVSEFLRFRYSETKLDELGYAELLNLLQTTQKDILRESFKFNGVKILEVDQIISIQAWIADKARAVFSIQTLASNSISHGLYTSDPLFVNALVSMIELYEAPIYLPQNTVVGPLEK